MTELSDIELRRRLASSLKRDAVPRPVWEILEAQGQVDAVRYGDLDYDVFVRQARTLLLYGDMVEQIETLPEPDQDTRTIEPPRFGGYEQERAETFGEYLKLIATAYPGVQEFRSRLSGYLPGARPLMPDAEPLTPEQAHQLVREPEMSRPKLRDRRGYYLFSSPKDNYNADPTNRTGRLEFYRRNPGEYEYIEFYQGSILEWLHEVSYSLIEDVYPPWREAEAAWFVLTGEAAVPKALVATADAFVNDHLTHGTITLQVEPWIAAETVTKVYQYLQSQMLGRKPRALSRRNLAVARFVMGELRRQLISGEPEEEWRPWRGPSWRKLMLRWNQANPESIYQDERQFYRDFYRAARAVVRPFDAAPLIDQTLGSPVGISLPEDEE